MLYYSLLKQSSHGLHERGRDKTCALQPLGMSRLHSIELFQASTGFLDDFS